MLMSNNADTDDGNDITNTNADNNYIDDYYENYDNDNYNICDDYEDVFSVIAVVLIIAFLHHHGYHNQYYCPHYHCYCHRCLGYYCAIIFYI